MVLLTTEDFEGVWGSSGRVSSSAAEIADDDETVMVADGGLVESGGITNGSELGAK